MIDNKYSTKDVDKGTDELAFMEKNEHDTQEGFKSVWGSIYQI